MSHRTKKEIAALELEFKRQQENLLKHSARWHARWNGITCPFEKVNDLNSLGFVAEREAVNAPWRAAKESLRQAKQVSV